jgi:hypothetical protein
MLPLLIAGGALLMGLWKASQGEKCEHTYAHRYANTSNDNDDSDHYSPEMGMSVHSDETFRVTYCTKCGYVYDREKISGGTRYTYG